MSEAKMRFLVALCMLFLCAPDSRAEDSVCAEAAGIAPEKSLLVTHVGVLDAPQARGTGGLSFAHVLARVFPQGTDVAEATQEWFDEWAETEAMGRLVHPRSQGLLLGLWPRTPSGALDLGRAPFHLIGAVYRPDLVTLRAPYGEARLVFGAFNPHNGDAIDFTAIFEFELPPAEHPAAWAQDFAALSELGFGAEYNRRLEALFSRILDASPTALAQVRTNDFYMGPEWELREFRLSPEGRFKMALTAQTPDLVYDSGGDNDLVDWIVANADAIAANRYEVPARFLAAGALAFDDSFKWFVGNPRIPEATRHQLGLNSCNGCHAGETRTRFLHLSPRREGADPEVSAFLRGQLPERLKIMQNLICGRTS